MWCVFRGGVPLYLYKSEGGASIYVWHETLGCTALAWRHATTTIRRGRVASRGERPPPRSGRPLTTASGQCLCVVGLGLVMGRYPMGFSHFESVWWVSPLLLCANQRRKAPFGELFHVFLFVTYKIMFSKYMWNLVNSKCICD